MKEGTIQRKQFNSIDFIFARIIKYKAIVGISFLLFGLPLLYLVRDGFRLAPNSSLVTQLFMVFSLFLLLPLRLNATLFSSNNKLLVTTLFFHFLCFLYVVIYRNPEVGMSQEVIYLSVNIIFLVLISYVSLENLEQNNILKFVLYLCLIQNLGVILFGIASGSFQVGQRFNLAVVSKSGDIEGITNPHIFGKGAYFGILVATTFLRFKLKSVPRYVTLATLFSSILLLSMSLSMSTILSLALLFFFLFLFANKLQLIRTVGKQISRPINALFLLLLIIPVVIFYFKNQYKIDHTIEVVSERFVMIINTIQHGKYEFGAKVQTDMSAGSRVENITYVYETFIEDIESWNFFEILFGRGYFVKYIDSPLIQTFLDMGIVGFVTFASWHIYGFILVRKYFKYNYSPFLFFVAGLYFIVFVTNVSQGVPYGYQNWIFMVLITRYLKNFTPQKTSTNEMD